MAFEDKVEGWFRQLLGLGDNSSSNHTRTRDKIDVLMGVAQTLVRNQEDMMKTLQDALAEVRKNSNLAGSIVTALQVQRDQIKALAAQKGLDAESQAIVEQIISELEVTDNQMSAAVIAGTPVATKAFPEQSVKNDGPTDAQKQPDENGLVPPTEGKDTASVDGPGQDQALRSRDPEEK